MTGCLFHGAVHRVKNLSDLAVGILIISNNTGDRLKGSTISLSEHLQYAIPLLMSAVFAGAAIPSQTLKNMGLDIPFDWKKLNEFTSNSEIRFSMGEGGEPWVEAQTFRPQTFQESDVEIDL